MISENGFQEPDLRNLGLDGFLGEHGQGHNRRRATVTGSQQSDLNDVVCIDADHLKVAAVLTEPRPNLFVKNPFHSVE
jgi:hypothetical protein